MTNERENLKNAINKFGSWFNSLEYVVNEELIQDYKKLCQLINDPSSENAYIGASILALGIRINRVKEKLDEVDNTYREFLKAAPEMISDGKQWYKRER